MRRRPRRPLLARLSGFALLALFATGLPASAAPSPREVGPLPEVLERALPRHAPFADLADAVRAGVLTPDAAAAASDEGLEAIVVLDGAEVLARGRAEARTAGTEALLEVTRPGYSALRDRVLSRLSGLRVLQTYRNVPLLHVRFDSEAALLRAANDPEVVAITRNRALHRALTESLPLIRQPQVQAAGAAGAGTAVAVLDTGIDYTHPAFGGCSVPGSPASCKVVAAIDTAPEDGQRDDGIRHGTNVGGIVVGVAPKTRLLSIDVFDGGTATVADIVEGIDFAISMQPAHNVRALNLSLGVFQTYFTSPCSTGNPLQTPFANARAAGIMPVVASGNDAFMGGSYTDGITFPACTPGAMSVGAVYDDAIGGITWGTSPDQCTDASTAPDQITCFSQSASFLTVLGPGALIRAAGVLQGGTSQATPHVAGAVAVLAGENSTASLDQITDAIANSGPSIPDSRNGVTKHRLDLVDAVAAIGAGPPPPPPPGTCTILGTNMSETLTGTAGDDVLCGKGGDDVLIPSGGNDLVIGGPGFDWVSLENASGSVVVDLAARTVTGAGGTHSLQAVEGVIGSEFNDTLMGDDGVNDFFGLGGDDTIFGRDGFDYLRFDFAGHRVFADMTTGTASGEGDDTFSGIRALTGSAQADTLRGNAQTNELYGFGGSDLLEGLGKADDLFGGPGGDELVGGRGDDDLLGGAGRDLCRQGPGSGVASSC